MSTVEESSTAVSTATAGLPGNTGGNVLKVSPLIVLETPVKTTTEEQQPPNQSALTSLNMPVSFAEVMDKLSILDLKLTHCPLSIMGTLQLDYLHSERLQINTIMKNAAKEAGINDATVLTWYGQLSQINSQLWDVEDKIRALIDSGEWMVDDAAGSKFAFNAMLVPYLNDLRSSCKKDINDRVHGDKHTELKIYTSKDDN